MRRGSKGAKRHALLNARLRTHEAGETTTRMLTSVAEIREVLTTVFGIQLPDTDKLDPALEKALAARGSRLVAPFVVNPDAVHEFKDLQGARALVSPRTTPRRPRCGSSSTRRARAWPR